MIPGASLLMIVALLVGAAAGFFRRDARAGYVVGFAGLVALLAYLSLGAFGAISPGSAGATALGCLALAMIGISMGVFLALFRTRA